MYVDVILPVAMATPTFTYFCSEDVGVGCRVVVPFGRGSKATVGLVLRVDVDIDPSIKRKIRPVSDILDRYPIVPQVTLDFWLWMSQYYMTPLGEVLRTQMVPILSKSFHFRSLIKRMNWRIKPSITLPEPLPFELTSDITTTLIVEHSPVRIESLIEDALNRFHNEDEGMVLVLTSNPTQATHLSQYLSQWWHVEHYNSTTMMQRRGELYTGIAMGITPQVVVGTKTALSLPARKWDAIIVLDAHLNVYKSERQPNLWARDAALYLSSLHKAKCYLVTSSPTVEMYYNAMQNKWHIAHSPKEEDNLQSIVLERGKELISKYVQTKITKVIASGKKIVVFQNRRGYSSWVECPKCGHIPFCEQCSAPMVYHHTQRALMCHHCNRSTPFNWQCGDCGAKMEPYGRGTERLQEQLQTLFPSATVGRIDSDIIDFRIVKMEPEWDIVVGTQLLFDNRISFQDVGLVCIANADNIGNAADFRSNENRYTIIKMIADRCRNAGAELVVQSSKVDDSVVKAALTSDFTSIYNAEIEDREANVYPPFARLISIEARGRSEAIVFAAGSDMEAELRPIFGNRLSPLYQPTVGKMAGTHIVRLLLKIERSRSSSKAKEILLEKTAPLKYKYRKEAEYSFDVDPLL